MLIGYFGILGVVRWISNRLNIGLNISFFLQHPRCQPCLQCESTRSFICKFRGWDTGRNFGASGTVGSYHVDGFLALVGEVAAAQDPAVTVTDENTRAIENAAAAGIL